jgi:large subunit ribosomal protein L25
VTRPVLAAQRREITGKDVARLRRQGILPAVLYGHGEASEPLQIDAKAFETLSRTSGRHALIDLKVDGERTHQAIVHDVQEHPVRRTPLHVDFQLVRMTEEMTMDVSLAPVGVSVAVEKHNGTLLQTLDHVRLRGLPGALPQIIEFDISALDSFEAVLRVRDLPMPAKVTLLTDLDEQVAHVQPSRAEVELEREAVAATGGAEEEAPEAEPSAEE